VTNTTQDPISLLDVPRLLRASAPPRRSWWHRAKEWWADRRLDRAMKQAEQDRECGA
jgi:hypothetical protein